MLSSYRQRRRAKEFLKMIGSEDLPVINPQAQMFWAAICARAAWRSFNSKYMIVPVLVEDEHMDSITHQQWLPLRYPASRVGFYPDDDAEAFRLTFDRTEPTELVADPQTQQVLGKAFDLLEQCEESVWDLPQPVTSAAHKLRTAINKSAQASLGGND